MNITVKVYASIISPPIRDGVKDIHFFSIDVAESISQVIAKLFNGKTDCSSSGTVQYSDTVYIDNISEERVEMLKKAFSFVSVRERVCV